MKTGIVTIMAVLVMQAAAAQSAGDAALLRMQDAFRKNQSTPLSQTLPQLRGHVLEPMAAYWEMRVRLDTAPVDQITQRLAALQGSYWEDRLRADWLALLARREQWDLFDAQWPLYRMRDERSLLCTGTLREWQRGTATSERAAADIARWWHAQREIDQGCAQAARLMLAKNALEEDVVWHRARLAMEVNQPSAAEQAMAMVDPARAKTVHAIAKQPERYLNDKVTAFRTSTKELVTLALIRLAANNPEAAVRALQNNRWRIQLTGEERSWVWGAIGKRQAQRLQDNALTSFAQGQANAMHDDHLAWKTRAALRAGQWGVADNAIAAMSPEQQQDPTWVYWKARVKLAQMPTQAQNEQAQAMLRSIASTRHFYGQLATEALGQSITLPTLPEPLSVDERLMARSNPGLQRALAAIRLGLRTEGNREWNYTVSLHTPGGMNDRELLAAADWACEQARWDRCIYTSKRTQVAHEQSQRFPLPHRDLIATQAGAIGLDPGLVFGLIRQESRFVTNARSHVGASGLMQVMPPTAKWTAKRIGLRNFKTKDINDQTTNVRIGTAYLKMVIDDFEGSLPLAVAAYNAGPSRSRNWRNGPILPGDIWVENIPFEETRDYVKRVLANSVNYNALMSGQPQSLRARLGTVGPRISATPINTELP
jgi:soluble lytic murein transglycosylase